MADDVVRQAISIDISDEGLAATHPLTVDFPRAVAPTQPGSDEFNSLRDFLVVVGCAMFPDVTFQFDSSLVGPDVRKATRRLALFREELQDFEGLKDGEQKAFPPIALFGHADPVGRISYNSKLSARRALCIYGMLLHEVGIWEDLFNDKSLPGDIWGDDEFNAVLDEVGFEPELPKDSSDEQKRKEILARLKKNPADRAKLFSAYMDAVCVKDDGKGGDTPFVLKKADFLDRGERTADHKGAVQGCGEFNPVLILSQAKQNRFERTGDKEGRDAANAPNRRVLAFFFKPGTRIVPEKWPCPSVKDNHPETTCKTRLWKDSARRLAPDPKPAESEAKDRAFGAGPFKAAPRPDVKVTGDTFGCRFYHGLAQNSPCEGTLKLWVLRMGLSDALKKDAQGNEIQDDAGRTFLANPIARRRYVLEAGKSPDSPIVRGRTDENGGIRIPVFDEKTTMQLKIDVQSLLDPQDPKKNKETEKETPEEEFLSLVLRAGNLLPLLGPDDPKFDRLAVRQRLSNLGFGPDQTVDRWKDEDEKEAISAFQRKHNLTVSGTADEPTLSEIRKVHGS
jgi:hypothetical protein